MITVKKGDTHAITYTVNADLTGATVRLLCKQSGRPDLSPTVLASTVTDAPGGVVSHTLTGTLAVGLYDIELEITKSGAISTSPTNGYEQLKVLVDLG